MISLLAIDESRKKFEYCTDKADRYKLTVREGPEDIYSAELDLIPGIRYYTEIINGFYDKIAIFSDSAGEFYSLSIPGLNREMQDVPEFIRFEDETPLCKIFDETGSDKASAKYTAGHNYSRVYYKYLEPLKDEPIKIFELGIGTNNVDVKSNMTSNGKPGASLRAWEKYFEKAMVYGADIDGRVLFNEGRIKTFYCDQTNPYVIDLMWNNKNLDFEFDVIVEDGLHEYQANITFLRNSIHKLKGGGHYFVEDISISDYRLWRDELIKLRADYSDFEFEFLRIFCSHNRHDNNMIHCTRKK